MIRATSQICRLVLFCVCLLALVSCSEDQKKAAQAADTYLKGVGLKETKLDLFCTSPSVPDKAYVAMTGTWGFADKSGNPQKEFFGFIVLRDGSGWKIDQDHPAAYTQEKEKALVYLGGGK
jgi:hypothetical protein